MNPLRIIILCILLYILYRILVGAKKKNVGQRNAPRPGAVQDVLVEDPVCHTYIPQQQAVVLKEKGNTHYFCSDACRAKFLSEKGD